MIVIMAIRNDSQGFRRWVFDYCFLVPEWDLANEINVCIIIMYAYIRIWTILIKKQKNKKKNKQTLKKISFDLGASILKCIQRRWIIPQPRWSIIMCSWSMTCTLSNLRQRTARSNTSTAHDKCSYIKYSLIT